MTSRRAAFTLLALAALVTGAEAHELGMVQVDATFRKDGTYSVDLLVDAEHLPTGNPTTPETAVREIGSRAVLSFDGRPASPSIEITPAVGGKPNVSRIRLAGRTPPGARSFSFSDAAVTGFFFVRTKNEGGAATTAWVEGGSSSPSFALDREVVPVGRWSVAKRYLALGYTHILPRGLDHVLFVLGIFLLAVEIRPMVAQVSAFTVAHTLTLGLTIYGVVSLSPRIVEPLIALSIVYVAVENVFTSRLHAWRPAIVFAFGLLHGMGFAGVLSGLGLPRGEFVPALLAFNAGVEGGQLTVIALAMLVLGLPFRRKSWYRARVVVPASIAIAAIGLFWAVERVFFPA